MSTIPWYRRILTEKKNEIVSSTVFAVLLALSVTLWHYFTGAAFVWQSISPVEAPDLLPRLFYSALVYVTLGSALYGIYFYKGLRSLYGHTKSERREHKKMKRVIWLTLILIMAFVIIPFVVDIVNNVISFFYNIFVLILYLLPAAGLSLVVTVGGYLLYKNIKDI